MSKQTRKLYLSKETVRSLAVSNLLDVRGGIPGPTIQQTCSEDPACEGPYSATITMLGCSNDCYSFKRC